jgi:predicted amidohydrolase
MTDFAIAGLQLEAVNGDNLDSMLIEIDNAVRKFPWLDMVLLGELNVYGSDPVAAEPMPGPTEAKFCEAARKNKVWLIPGSMLEASDGAIYNTTPVINPDGEVVARYRKQFPWLPYEVNTTPGDEFTVFEVPGVGRFGISICYDMWFPETDGGGSHPASQPDQYDRQGRRDCHDQGSRGPEPGLLLRRERRRTARGGAVVHCRSRWRSHLSSR